MKNLSNKKILTCIFLNSIILSIFLFASCEFKVDTEQEQEALLQTDMEFAQTSVERGAPEAFYQYLTDDALQLPNNAEPVVGRDLIRESMQKGQEVLLTWKPQKAEVAQSGDLGYTWGTYEAKSQNPNGEENIRYGKYLNIWKKQADGKWKVAVDMGNPSPPPENASNQEVFQSTLKRGNNNMTDQINSRVTGIGGIFFKAQDSKKLMKWYNEHLGIKPEGDWGAKFEWREVADPERKGYTIWSAMSKDTSYFDPSQASFMINYRVANLNKLIEQLKNKGVAVSEPEKHPQGLFAWVMDPEGNRIELWEPQETNLKESSNE
jgi:ketosteroid isomerase-like protein/predicted enzyme related to lactoylglutathione lyase